MIELPLIVDITRTFSRWRWYTKPLNASKHCGETPPWMLHPLGSPLIRELEVGNRFVLKAKTPTGYKATVMPVGKYGLRSIGPGV
jgi:hypothetical protein